MLDSFKNKYQPIQVVCSEAEKDALLKKISATHIFQFWKNSQSKDESDQYNVVYIPKMTAEDRKALKKLQGANPATARKLMTWEIVNVHNQQMLDELKSAKGQATKKTVKFKGDYELELYDMTDREDFVWLIHTEPNSAAHLIKTNQRLTEGKLWDNMPFISCSLQDGFTKSYAGNQSIAHGVSAFPFSFILEVDPNAIISADPHDARTPEGSDKTRHLKYVQPTLAQRLEQDQSQRDVIPKGTVAELQAAKPTGILSAEQLIKNTKSYNEVTIVSGELARDWGVKPPTIKGIVIEKEHLDRYLQNQELTDKRYLGPILGSLSEIIKLAKASKLPVILIDPKPELKKTIQSEATAVNDQIVMSEDSFGKGNYFKKELEHYISMFKLKLTAQDIDPVNKAWYEHMIDFLQQSKIDHWEVALPAVNYIEEQVLLSIILAEAKLDANIVTSKDVESKLSKIEVKDPNEIRTKNLTNWSKKLMIEKQQIEDSLQKAKKELNQHVPNLHFDVEGLPKPPKNKT